MLKQIIIDVREPEEFATGHVANAINIPPDELQGDTSKLNDVPKDGIIVYCVSGSRSNVALNILKHRGYINVINGINKDHVNVLLLQDAIA